MASHAGWSGLVSFFYPSIERLLSGWDAQAYTADVSSRMTMALGMADELYYARCIMLSFTRAGTTLENDFYSQ